MKGRIPEVIPIEGICPQTRPDHNTGDSVPYSFKTVHGFFYVAQNCEQ